MDAASVTSAAQRKSKLERQREIMQKKRQQKRALEIHALRTKSFNSLLDTNPVSPRLALKTPARSQQRGVSEKFAYDGPQAFELGNPDLLDPPIQILRVSEDNTDGVARSDKSVRSASALTQRVSSADAASKTASTYQAIHIPPTRPMKLPLPVSPLAGPDRRALVDIHEGEREEGEDGGEKKRVVATTSTTREAGGRRTKTTRKRQPAAALRPHSAAEAMHSSRGKQANLIDLDDVDMLSVEASPASAIADWSVTPSTTSGVSFHWREKTQPDSSRYREVSAQKAGRPVKRRVKKPSPVEAPSGPKTGTSKKSQRTQKPVRVRRQEKPQSRDIPAREGSSQGVDKGEEGVRSKITRIFNAGDDVEEFVRSPAPKGVTVRCRISRDKRGLERGLFPNYFLHLEREEDNRRFFLLAARRRRRAAANCNYAISLDAADSLDSSNSDHSLTVGRLRSNFLGTRFVLSSCRNYNRHDTCCSVSGGLGDNSKEIAAVTYEANILGFKGPRRMTVLLPREDEHRNPPNPHVVRLCLDHCICVVYCLSLLIYLANIEYPGEPQRGKCFLERY
uniref:Tub domain-containing protein n=1 Tax=Mesocestoides corti TaxID=53468 RepID=A0A5K3F7Y4_MESCO